MDPIPGDFVLLVKSDCEKVELNLSETEISKIPKGQFKKIVKTKINSATFKYLKAIQQNHSKMRNIKYEKFEMIKYLNSPLFNDKNRTLLLALRTRTVRGIRSDFGGLYQDKMCPLGCGEFDNLENLLTCSVLREQHISKEITHTDIKFEDIFSSDISKQQKVTELFYQLLETRNKMLQSIPVPTDTGPVHGSNAVQNLSLL